MDLHFLPPFPEKAKRKTKRSVITETLSCPRIGHREGPAFEAGSVRRCCRNLWKQCLADSCPRGCFMSPPNTCLMKAIFSTTMCRSVFCHNGRRSQVDYRWVGTDWAERFFCRQVSKKKNSKKIFDASMDKWCAPSLSLPRTSIFISVLWVNKRL